MNTEEAIDIVCIGREELLSIKGANNIVNLLRELEKYRQMWGKLKATHNRESVNAHCPEGLKDEWLFTQEIKLLEQKYLPKVVKSDGS